MGKVRYLAAGDSSVSVEFGNEISPEINRQIRAFKIAVEKSGIPGIVETVPTYRSLLVNYKPEVIRFQDLTKEFEGLLGSLGSIVIPPPEVIEIPVLYGGEMGPDIENVAKHNNKTVEEVIKIHTSEEYLIYMLGFSVTYFMEIFTGLFIKYIALFCITVNDIFIGQYHVLYFF